MAIARDVTGLNTGGSTSPVTSNSPSVAAGATVGLVFYDLTASGAMTTITWDGSSMTKIREYAAGTQTQGLFGIANPSSGVTDIVMTFTGGGTVIPYFVTYTGTTAAVPTNFADTTASTGETISQAITTAKNQNLVCPF